MEVKIDYEGALFVEVFKIYEEMYCSISSRKFQAFRKARSNAVADSANKAELALQVRPSSIFSLEFLLIPFFLSLRSQLMSVNVRRLNLDWPT